MAKIALIRYRCFFYLISLALFLFGGFAPYFFPIHFGADLTGGEVAEFKTTVSVEQTQAILKDLGVREPIVSTLQGIDGQSTMVIKAQAMKKDILHQRLAALDAKADLLRFEQTSPAVSGELRKRALTSILLVLLGVGGYVAYAFRQRSGKISGWLLGAVVILTLFHDVVSSFGLFALASQWLDLSFDSLVITGFLVVAGFSVHDTIVVFDRLREHLNRGRAVEAELFNQSVRETFARSLNTSLTAILAISPLVVFFPHLHSFLLPLIFGIAIGTYSSIFIAVPLVYDLTRK